MAGRARAWRVLLLVLAFMAAMAVPDMGQAAEEAASSGGYLAGYENAEPMPTAMSWWSTLAYLLSLLAIFGFVVVTAYFAARFLGGHFSGRIAGRGSRVLDHMALGPNRSVCVVEMADRVLLLGVTEHSITMLSEITDEAEIERLRRDSLARPLETAMFSREFGTLSALMQKIRSH